MRNLEVGQPKMGGYVIDRIICIDVIRLFTILCVCPAAHELLECFKTGEYVTPIIQRARIPISRQAGLRTSGRCIAMTVGWLDIHLSEPPQSIPTG